MKQKLKVFLIGSIIFCMFQLIVMAADIDIGCEAINRGTYASGGTSGKTLVNIGNPANASGKITTIEIWANDEMEDVVVATFFVVSGNNLSTRDTHAIGTVSDGKQTFPGLDIEVEVGDYLGIQWAHSVWDRIEADDSGGSGLWRCTGDQIPCNDVTFTVDAGQVISLYGTGETPPPTGITWNGITITKWNGITITTPLNTQ